MAKHTCDKCGNALEPNAVFCPNCGAAVFHGNATPNIAKPSKVLRFLPSAAIVVAIIAVGCLIWSTFDGAPDPQPSSPSTEQTTPQTTAPTQTDPPETTAPTETDPSATTEPVTQPTETKPPETEPIPTLSGDPLSQEQLNEYQNNLATNRIWNCATTTVFSDPSQINLGLLFYNGIADGRHELTDEELAHFTANGEKPLYGDIRVLPPDQISQILIEYFGITLEETDKRGMDQFTYWEETGNYYRFIFDANGNYDIEVIAGSTLSDGSVQILYSSSGAHLDAGLSYGTYLWIMTFIPEGTIFSNLPA